MHHQRIQTYFLLVVGILGVVILRLAYWQIVRGPSLRSAAKIQYSSKNIDLQRRGEILFQDNSPLVINKPIYQIGVYLPGFSGKKSDLSTIISNLQEYTITDPLIATDSVKYNAKIKELQEISRTTIEERISRGGYVALAQNVSEEVKSKILESGLSDLTFDQGFTRDYPEASLAAQLTGFVGKDEGGEPLGYFGLEGYYNRELSPRAKVEQQEKDALGNPLLTGTWELLPGRVGRSLSLYLDRAAQHIVSEELAKGIARYRSISGEVVVMDPRTGGIIAMVSLPTYDPAQFYLYDTTLYKNPAIANTYEPGSTFKVMVASAALNEGVIDPSDHCDICAQPVSLGKYTIKTWDNNYREGATPEEIIVHSDNTGMVWMQRRLGPEKFLSYIQKFGFGEKTGIDLQEEVASPLRTRWGEIDYATSSFGQGIAVTSIQMIQAVGAIANKGVMMEPHVVKEVIGESIIPIPSKDKGQIITQETAQKITQYMVSAVDQGEAKWAKPKGYQIAGKTGTAQIAVAGHYDAEKTITSFVGFAPAYNPRFVMLVKLNEPQTSQWGSETAAPLWFNIAKKLLLHYNIAPSTP